MTDYIKREDAQDIIARKLSDYITDEERWILEYVEGEIGDIPSADVVEVDEIIKIIQWCKDNGWTEDAPERILYAVNEHLMNNGLL